MIPLPAWAQRGAAILARPSYSGVEDDDRTAAFHAKQLHALLRLTPYTMSANAVNATVICVIFWNRVPRPPLLAWAAVLAGVLTIQTVGWWRHGRGPARARASRRVMRLATWHAASLAVLYAALAMYLFPRVAGEERLLVATFTAGMMCAGAFALFTVPRAGIAWVSILAVG